jgi:preprotein translocase subunit SecG
METFVAVVHILVAFVLIGLVLIQDTKSGSVGVFGGGGGSNSVLGATGATTLAQKMTRWVAAIFAVTCIALSVFSVRSRSSILDGLPVVPAAATTAPAASTTEANAAGAPTGAPAVESAPAIAPTGGSVAPTGP